MGNKKENFWNNLLLGIWSLMATGKTYKLQSQQTLLTVMVYGFVLAALFTVLIVFFVVPGLSTAGTGVKGIVSSSGLACSGASFSPIINVKGTLADPTNSFQPAQFAIATNGFLANATFAGSTPVWSIGTVASGLANAGSGNVACGQAIWMYWGDNVNFYIQPWPAPTSPTTITQSITTFTNPGIEKMAALTPSQFSYSNVISTVTAANVMVFGTVAGSAIPQATFTLKGGLYSYGAQIPGDYGSGTICIAVGYNTVAFRNIGLKSGSITGRLVNQQCQPTSANSYTNEGYVAFEFPSSLVNASATSTFTLTGTATSSYTVAMTQLNTNYPLNIYINDKVLQATGGLLTPTYLNINTGTDLGTAATPLIGNIVLA